VSPISLLNGSPNCTIGIGWMRDARTLLDALTLWEGTGTAVAQAAQAVSGLLADHGIGNLIAGSLAVQLHGYPSTTVARRIELTLRS
jgi:hypothetical protein